MGMFDFVRDAGEKIFGFGGDDEPVEAARTMEDALADKETGKALWNVVTDNGLKVDELDVKFMDGVATVRGKAASQAEREKAILLIGNTQGVARVDDRIKVEKPEPEATMYTVQSGDSLSKISKAQYGDAMKYMVIFEANTPMLKDPNKIYPGQVLRIPKLS